MMCLVSLVISAGALALASCSAALMIRDVHAERAHRAFMAERDDEQWI